ncbi:MAG: CCC motif membrane protein [Nonlabens sp.]|nr:CCC motif membrane protein [Nonlabens sp.]
MQKLNTTLVYILAIVGFLCCCCNGIGVIPAAIGFFIASKGVKQWQANPDAYANGPAMKTAKTVALVAMILSGLVALYSIYQMTTTDSEERKEQTIKSLRDAGLEDDQIDQIEPYIW